MPPQSCTVGEMRLRVGYGAQSCIAICREKGEIRRSGWGFAAWLGMVVVGRARCYRGKRDRGQTRPLFTFAHSRWALSWHIV
jgi:hypothetical protein